jgi:hypothetical protein
MGRRAVAHEPLVATAPALQLFHARLIEENAHPGDEVEDEGGSREVAAAVEALLVSRELKQRPQVRKLHVDLHLHELGKVLVTLKLGQQRRAHHRPCSAR